MLLLEFGIIFPHLAREVLQSMPEFVSVSKKRQRYTFGRARDLVEMPDMIEVQRDSYRWFYQDDITVGLG